MIEEEKIGEEDFLLIPPPAEYGGWKNQIDPKLSTTNRGIHAILLILDDEGTSTRTHTLGNSLDEESDEDFLYSKWDFRKKRRRKLRLFLNSFSEDEGHEQKETWISTHHHPTDQYESGTVIHHLHHNSIEFQSEPTHPTESGSGHGHSFTLVPTREWPWPDDNLLVNSKELIPLIPSSLPIQINQKSIIQLHQIQLLPIEEEPGMHTSQPLLPLSSSQRVVINHASTERQAEGRLLRSVLRKPGGSSKGRKGRCVTFNESLNLFYDAECSCWIHEEDYVRYRQEEYERREREELYEYAPLHFPNMVEFDEPPTLSPPEGYKDRFFPQQQQHQQQYVSSQEIGADPDVTRVSPPSPPTARRKVFLRDGTTSNTLSNGQEEDVEEEAIKNKKGLRLGGILKGGRLWRSNSSDGKKVVSPPEEPDVVKCTESSNSNANQPQVSSADVAIHSDHQPTKVSIGTAPLRTSEQIRLAVDSTLRSRKNKKPECSTLVEKLRWLTSLDDEDSDSNQSGFATWPSPRDKNGLPIPNSSPSCSNSGGSTKKTDAGTSTNDEQFILNPPIRLPGSVQEAKIKQISYTLEDIEEGLKGTDLELETFVSKDALSRVERIRKRYGEEGGDDYGFSRRPSVKGIKPKFSSTNQIFAQFTNRKSVESPPVLIGNHVNSSPQQLLSQTSRESDYENTRLPIQSIPMGATIPKLPVDLQQSECRGSISCEYTPALLGRAESESRTQFELIRQSFEAGGIGMGPPGAPPNFLHRPHSWSVSTLPHPAHHNPGGNNNGHLPQSMVTHHQSAHAHLLPHPPIYGTVRRVPNVIGRPLFLHYGALSVEAHPNKIPTYPPMPPNTVKIPETPSPTQQTPVVPIGMRYYGPPIRYYNQPPPVPPRTVTATTGQGVVVPAPVPIGINNLSMISTNPPTSLSTSITSTHPHVNLMALNEVERGVPEGATDEEHPIHKETYSMNV